MPRAGVVPPLLSYVNLRRALRRHLQREVRRLPLLRNHIPVAGLVSRRIHLEGHQQVRIPSQVPEGTRLGDYPAVRLHQRPIGIAEVLGQVVGVAGLVQLVVAGHLVGFPLGRVRQPEPAPDLGSLGEGVECAHFAPGNWRQGRPVGRSRRYFGCPERHHFVPDILHRRAIFGKQESAQ